MNSPRHKPKFPTFSINALAISCFAVFGALTATQASAKTTVQPIEFGKCGEGLIKSAEVRALAQCGQIVVAQDRSKPNGKMLTLPVMRIPAKGDKVREPIFFLTGGPGASNLGDILPLGRVHNSHDVYFVGYRGADGSSVLTCSEISAEIGKELILSPKGLDGLGKAASSCAARLTSSGFDLGQFTMLNVIDDLEQARVGIGAEKINLLSLSYGSRVAQYYARRHSNTILRSAMFGANPPGHFVFSAYVNDKVVDRLAALCVLDKSCSSQTKDLKKTIYLALTAGSRTGNPKIDDGAVRIAMFLLLYGRDGTKMFLNAAVSAENGDYSGLEQASELVRQTFKDNIFGDMFTKGSTDSYRYNLLKDSFALTDSSVGSPIDILYSTFTSNWPVALLPAEYRTAAMDLTPTLIVSGGIDVATPPIFVEAELMPYLPNGKHIVIKDYGHNDFTRQADAFGEILAGFFSDGSINTSLLTEDAYSFDK